MHHCCQGKGTATIATTMTNPDGTYTFWNVIHGVHSVPGVKLTLFDSNGAPVSTAATNAGDAYVFNKVEPGDYNVVETQEPKGYPNSLSDLDEDPDHNTFDNDQTVYDMINVTLEAGEEDKGNNFVNSDSGSISGAAESDVNANKCLFVEIKLLADLTLLAVPHCSNRWNWSVHSQGG